MTPSVIVLSLTLTSVALALAVLALRFSGVKADLAKEQVGRAAAEANLLITAAKLDETVRRRDQERAGLEEQLKALEAKLVKLGVHGSVRTELQAMFGGGK